MGITFVPRAGYRLAFDLGGTTGRLAILNRALQPVHGKIASFPIRDCSLDTVQTRLAEGIRDIRNAVEPEVMSDIFVTGVCVAGPIDPKSGVIPHFTNNHKLNGWQITKFLKDLTGVPAFAGNDTTAGSLAELAVGAAQGIDDFGWFVASTGIGGKVVLGGNVQLGSSYKAGEPGHMVTDPQMVVKRLMYVLPPDIHHAIVDMRFESRQCGCSNEKSGIIHTDHLESWGSGPAMEKTAFQFIKNERLRQLLPTTLSEVDDRGITTYNIYDAYNKGDLIAKLAIDFTSAFLAIGISTLQTVNDVKKIIVAGGLTSNDYYLRSLNTFMSHNPIPFRTREESGITLVEKSRVEEPCLIGAGVIAEKGLEAQEQKEQQ